MWNAKHRAPKTEAVQCPVCQKLLGKRDTSLIYMAHCEECRTMFTWKPWTLKPSAQLDRLLPKRCGCGGCGR